MVSYRHEDLVIIIPIRARAHRVRPVLESAQTGTPGARVLFCVNEVDKAVRAEIRAAGAEELVVCPRPLPGDYARKVNAAVRATTEPLLFTGADDLVFHPGWFDAAVAKLTPGVGVVGTNDLGSARVMAGKHGTHFLLTRTYVEQYGTIDEPGKVFHEGYWHEFVDDELVATAIHRGAWAHAADSHVEHLHPNWGKAPSDRLYSEQPTRMRQGRRIFDQRRLLWTSR